MTTLTAEKADQILTIIQLIDPDADMRTDYSGRGMYGERCLGYVTSYPEQVGAAVAMALANSEFDSVEMMGRANRDAMGLAWIVYFPGTTVASAAA